MNTMHAIYLRSLLLVVGFVGFLLVEAFVEPPQGAPGAAPSKAVGHGHAPA